MTDESLEPIPILWLEAEDDFPPVSEALKEPNGLLAAGGCLSSSMLLKAYRQGIFPWYNIDEPILWWAPDPRQVLFPPDFHRSRSFKKFLKHHNYTISINRNFKLVIAHCAQPRNYTSNTWINSDMFAAYNQLHQCGYAHSVEIYDKEKLVGGLYGIALKPVFFGESMFALNPNTSKLALYTLCQCLMDWGYEAIDCQVKNAHLSSLGAVDISREAFGDYLGKITQHQDNLNWPARDIQLPG